MKKLMMVGLLLASVGLAADVRAVHESAKPLIGAVFALANDDNAHYLPGYGFHIGATYPGGPDDLVALIPELSQVLVSLAPMVRGLEAGEVVSVAARTYESPFRETLYVLVRVQADGTGLEVWVNGELRDIP